jgi:hypothetical protein
MVWGDVIVFGAVYRPLRMVPTLGDADQLIPAFVVPLIIAESLSDCPAFSVVDDGVAIEILIFEIGEIGWPSSTIAVAVLVGSAKL